MTMPTLSNAEVTYVTVDNRLDRGERPRLLVHLEDMPEQTGEGLYRGHDDRRGMDWTVARYGAFSEVAVSFDDRGAQPDNFEQAPAARFNTFWPMMPRSVDVTLAVGTDDSGAAYIVEGHWIIGLRVAKNMLRHNEPGWHYSLSETEALQGFVGWELIETHAKCYNEYLWRNNLSCTARANGRINKSGVFYPACGHHITEYNRMWGEKREVVK